MSPKFLARSTRFRKGWLCMMAALVLGSGCGSNNNDFAFAPAPNGPNPVVALQIVGGDSLSSPGSQRQFTVLGTSSDGSINDLSQSVRWSSTDPRLSIDSDGLATVASALPSGTRVTVTATVPSSGLESSSVLTVGQYLYVAGGSEGLDRFSVDPATARLSALGSTVSPGNPRGLVLSPNGRYIYLTNQAAGTLSAFQVSPTDGSLTAVSGSPFPGGASPVLLAIEPTFGRLLISTDADAEGNQLRLYRVNPDSGALTLLRTLGSEQGVGSGVQAVAFNPNAPYFFVANRSDNTVSAFSYNQDGEVSEVEGSPFATGLSPGYAQVDPTGRFLYLTNFQGASVSAFAIALSGNLTEVPGSPFITPAGPQLSDFDDDGSHYFVGTTSGTVQSFSVNRNTGALVEVDRVEGLETPRALDYNPARRSLYVAEAAGQDVHRLTFDENGGTLELAETVLTSYERPFGLVVTP